MKIPIPPGVTNTAIKMIGSWFGHKLDAFLGMAVSNRHGFRGATAPRKTKSVETKANGTEKPVKKQKYVPFHLQPGYTPKPPSRRDRHREAVAAGVPTERALRRLMKNLKARGLTPTARFPSSPSGQEFYARVPTA